MKLTENDFKLKVSKSEVTMNISNELLEMLKKDGYAQNLKAGKETSSQIELKTRKANFTLWNNTAVIYFDDDEIKNKTKFIDIINDKLIWLESKKKLVEHKMISGLLSLKNETWLDENEKPLLDEELILKINLESIQFSSDNSFTLYFNDGQLFGGHQISMSINSIFEFKNPSI